MVKENLNRIKMDLNMKDNGNKIKWEDKELKKQIMDKLKYKECLMEKT